LLEARACHRARCPSPIRIDENNLRWRRSRQIVNFAWSRDGKRLAVARATVANDVVLLKAGKN
jgi:hypothetical protein